MTLTQYKDNLVRAAAEGKTLFKITYNDATHIALDRYNVTLIEVDEPDGSKTGTLRIEQIESSGIGAFRGKPVIYADVAMVQGLFFI